MSGTCESKNYFPSPYIILKWISRENLLQRVKALQNKQRSGNVAPPTTPYTPSPGTYNVFGNNRRVSSMEVPEFTPLARRAPPLMRTQMKRPVLPPPVTDNSPFGYLEPETVFKKQNMPMSLLAPRYSHLLDEAILVSQTGTDLVDKPAVEVEEKIDVEADANVSSLMDDSDAAEEDAELADVTTILLEDEILSLAPAPVVPATIGKRVKGFLFSYLPTMSKMVPPSGGAKKTGQPGLPLPPLDVLGKPRGPIETPVRPPQPKPKHPKEIVQLNPAPKLSAKATMIPRVKKPQRLVELQHVPLPEQCAPKVEVLPRPRRSSGASVKDLVRNFEEKGKDTEAGKLTRAKSVVAGRSSKPSWR